VHSNTKADRDWYTRLHYTPVYTLTFSPGCTRKPCTLHMHLQHAPDCCIPVQNSSINMVMLQFQPTTIVLHSCSRTGPKQTQAPLMHLC